MRTPSLHVTALTVCAALVSLPALAGPVEMPNRKPGLWEVKVNAGAQMPAMTMQQCTDASTDKDMASTFSPMAKEMCAKQDMQKTTTGLVIESTCTVSGVTSTSRTEIVGDFNSAYTVKVATKGSGKIPDSVTTMEAKWMGACKADQKPGDIVMPGGMKMNIKDMQSMTGARPKQ